MGPYKSICPFNKIDLTFRKKIPSTNRVCPWLVLGSLWHSRLPSKLDPMENIKFVCISVFLSPSWKKAKHCFEANFLEFSSWSIRRPCKAKLLAYSCHTEMMMVANALLHDIMERKTPSTKMLHIYYQITIRIKLFFFNACFY